jgi:membrane-associated phospholipid phosphatase
MPPTPERWPSADDPAPVDAGPPQAEPVEERPADELSTDRADASGGRAHQDPGGAAPPRQVRPCRLPFGGAAVHPTAGRPLRRVSDFANLTKPWFITACFLALFGGPHGRRAALTGLVAIGAASLLVNQPMKLIGERHRPDRDGLGVPRQRWVTMPSWTSFPSGHSVSAAAFAAAVGDLLPALKLPLRGAASVVAFSRVYTGVHYLSDVLVGATVGPLLGRVASRSALW